jgi:hypothetical protein
MNKYGTVLIEEEEVEIEEYFQTIFKDSRVITCCKLVDNRGYTIFVEDVQGLVSKLYFSKENYIGLISTGVLFLSIITEDIKESFLNPIDKDVLEYKGSKKLEF